ncbi:sulfite exporter TauE/SafE family protein [Erwinia psidii]|uniref:Probable membrane transporter protein n=1 Tax=Erwinia psidii TaxID=69224 RepID=A0A3N6UU88_9GAMM|nr:sulfite exporter TauE/SafE family protein [Erwinia psidii]MCX8957665.1 sulfite exporter TauE/SafE family protein [Erwinia psidii]MCX8960720.1 sulfite exporter TauE/SafE family protein [Erwinia psidii]MCX8964035.1 sulfite exporter TauE/SafE family protein [Erwinia psidii]RQM39519.1 sulfite exporter TauE/SafE family protein [Erwinia psidii]
MFIQEIGHSWPDAAFFLLLTGLIVGLLLALTGGGGSVVCVPLLLYLVRMKDTHMVIGTSAMAVAVSALVSLLSHAAKGHVRWAPGLTVSLVAMCGALSGAEAGKLVSEKYLLLPFSCLMLVVALLMLRKKSGCVVARPAAGFVVRPFLVGPVVFTVGGLAGLLGIGGGFLVVPVLVWLFNFSMTEAVATSLMVVFTTGMSTSISYALAGKVSAVNTLLIIAGGCLGGLLGATVASRLKKNEMIINIMFSLILIVTALYMFTKNI